MVKDSRDREKSQLPTPRTPKSQSAHQYKITPEWYKTMIQGAEEGFLLFESNGLTIDVNESLCSMLGYSRKEMLSMTVFDFGFGLSNDAEQLSKMVDQLKQLGGVYHFESQLNCKIGIQIDVICSIQYLDIESGFIFCFFHDNTEHKMLDRKLKESEHKFRELFDEAPIAYIYVDFDGFIRDSNKEAQKLLGYTHDELSGIKIFDLHPEELMADGMIIFKQARQGKIIQDKEVVHINKNGDRIICLLSINPVRNAEGEIIALRSTLKDITMLKSIERQLRESRQLLENIIKEIRDGFAVINPDGILKDVNDSLCRMTGFSQEELVGIKMPYPFWADESVDTIKENISNNLEGIFIDFEVLLKKKNGKCIPVIVSPSCVKDDSGRVVLYMQTIKDISERKKIEIQLQESKEFSENIIRSMKDGFSLLSDKGEQLDVNDAFCRMTWFERSELVGKKPPYPYWPEEEYDNIQAAFQKTLHCEFDDFELVFKRKDGERFPVIVSPYYIKNANGELSYYVATVKDISERKKLEKQLQEKKDFSEKIIRVMKDGFSMFNKEGVLLNVNEALCHMTGYEYHELVGQKAPFPYWAEEDYDTITGAFKKVLNGEFSDFELVFKKKSGERFPVIVSPYSVVNAGGKIIYFMSTIKDITARKKISEAIKLEAERLKSLVEIVQRESDSIQQLLDFTLEEAIKLTKSKIGYVNFYDEDRKEFTFNTWSKDTMKECAIVDTPMVFKLEDTGIWGEAVRQAKPVVVNDFQAYNSLKKGYPAGHAKIHKYLTIPVFYQNGIVAVIAVANKETDYNESDVQQLILLMDSAWKAVLRKRAEESLKTQLQQKMEYTRALVHELKTPLTSLQISSDILSEIATESPYKDVSNNIGRSVKQLSKRADELLDIAKGEIGLLNLRCRKVNLEALCEGLKEELIPIAQKKDIALECINNADIVSAKMDEERILQVIYNLFDNALKFTPRGGRIEISIKSGKDNIFISVKDSGCGISKEKIDSLFNPRKTSPENNQRFSGLGVGLILSKMLIELHGGNISLESEVHKGAKFTFSLPICGNK